MSSAMRAASVVIADPGAGAPEDGGARRQRRGRARRRSAAHVAPPRGGIFAARDRGVAGHAVPRVPHRVLDLLPGRPVVAPVLVAIPAGPEVGFGLVEGAPGVMPRRLEPVAVGRTEALVVIGADGVGTAREVLVPEVVFSFPRGRPVVA